MFSKLFEGHKDLDCIEGTNLFLQFNVIKPIGKGNNQVFLVEHNLTQERLAMKEIVIASVNELHEIVKKEIKLLQSLNNHPQIIQFHDYCILTNKMNEFTTSMQAYILMELAENGSLDQLVGRTYYHSIKQLKIQKYFLQNRQFLSAQIEHFLNQALDAFCYLQNFNVAHCDIKPENILISDLEKLTIKICDIGSAKHLTSSFKLNNHQIGTVTYMSPEFLRFLQTPEDTINFFKSDVFSFGLVLLNMCTFEKFHLSERALYMNDVEKFEQRLNEMMNQIPNQEEIWGEGQIIKKILKLMLEVQPKKRMDFIELNQKWEQLKDKKFQKSKKQFLELKEEIIPLNLQDLKAPFWQKEDSHYQEKQKNKVDLSQLRIDRQFQGLKIKKTNSKIGQNKLEDSYQLLNLSEQQNLDNSQQFELLIHSQRFQTNEQNEVVPQKIEKPSFSLNRFSNKIAANFVQRNGSCQKQISTSTQLNSIVYSTKKIPINPKKLPNIIINQNKHYQNKQVLKQVQFKQLLQNQKNDKNEFSDLQFTQDISIIPKNESFAVNRAKILKNSIKLSPLTKFQFV